MPQSQPPAPPHRRWAAMGAFARGRVLRTHGRGGGRPAGRSDPGAQRRPGQAAGRVRRRGGRARGLPAHGGRRRCAPGGPRAVVGRPRPAGAAPARAARRRRDRRALELAVHDGRRAVRAGTGRRQHRRLAGRADHGRLLGRARIGAGERHGPARGRAELPERRRTCGGRRARRPSGRGCGRLHRFGGDRPVGVRSGSRESADPGAGRERAARGVGRRRPRGGGRRNPRGGLPVRRAELHGRRADRRASRRPGRAGRAAGGGRDRAGAPGRPVRGRHDDGPAQQRRRGGQDGRARRARLWGLGRGW